MSENFAFNKNQMKEEDEQHAHRQTEPEVAEQAAENEIFKHTYVDIIDANDGVNEHGVRS